MSGETAAGRQLAAGDLRVGSVVAERQVTLDAASFEGFAQLTGDAHPIHYDQEYASAKGLRTTLAHGLLLAAITALGATPLSAQLSDSMVAMLGANARFIAPVYLGETVTIRFTVAAVDAKSTNRSVVAFDVDVLSATGEPRARVRQTFMLKTRLEGNA